MSWQVVIVTGASRGYGTAVCVAFAKAAKVPTYFVICGRNVEGLVATTIIIQSVTSESQFIVETVVADLSNVAELEENAAKLFSLRLLPAGAEVTKVVLINNHGAVQPLGPIETTRLTDISAMINLNVTGFCFLTSDFVRRFKSNLFSSSCSELLIVNISSLAAIQPLPTMAVYCAGKAAREMYLMTLAEDLKTDTQLIDSSKTIRVLSYAPGPMDTDMMKEIVHSSGKLHETDDFNRLVDVHESASKLVRVLQLNKFENAQHVDYFDDIE